MSFSIRVLAVLLLAAGISAGAEVDGVTVSGQPAPRLAPFDQLVARLMQQFHIPGAALAVARDGRLVLAHGYALPNADAVQPDALFRIASLSKAFTAAAVMQLVERGKLRLDDHPFDLLKLGNPTDARLRRITIRNLLQHTGGWDRDQAFDPMFIPAKAANAVGAPVPASCETVIRYMLTQPLQSDPGTKYAYSNFGYCVLGRVIEKVTGERYDAFVKRSVLAPAGITRMRVGHSLASGRAPGEVRYFDYPGAPEVRSIFPDFPGMVPRPYGGWHLEAMDSHGGWIASAVDILRFLLHLDGHLAPRVVREDSVKEMIARPAGNVATDPDTWYGFGLQVRKVGNDANWWHTGSLDGTATLMVRTSQGMHWALLFNSRPQRGGIANEMDTGLWKAARAVEQWPAHDLFPSFE